MAAHGIRRRPLTARWLLAGPGTLAAAMLLMAAMPVWVPAGEAAVNNIAYPLILAPLIWAGFFTYALIEENLVRGTAVVAAVVATQGFLVAIQLAGAA